MDRDYEALLHQTGAAPMVLHQGGGHPAMHGGGGHPVHDARTMHGMHPSDVHQGMGGHPAMHGGMHPGGMHPGMGGMHPGGMGMHPGMHPGMGGGGGHDPYPRERDHRDRDRDRHDEHDHEPRRRTQKHKTTSQDVRNFPIGFVYPNIPAGQTQEIEVKPQVRFQGHRLAVAQSIARYFNIVDIKVGKDSQLAATGEMPGEAFSSLAVGTQVELDPAPPGIVITLLVHNIDTAPQSFGAVLYGLVEENED
jgi:hypothetical protein